MGTPGIEDGGRISVTGQVAIAGGEVVGGEVAEGELAGSKYLV